MENLSRYATLVFGVGGHHPVKRAGEAGLGRFALADHGFHDAELLGVVGQQVGHTDIELVELFVVGGNLGRGIAALGEQGAGARQHGRQRVDGYAGHTGYVGTGFAGGYVLGVNASAEHGHDV